eukprot:Amastigsp_a340909_9.p3 type:complete len:116 gc:universal Amastigsp_a340909_9:388-41(-)
MNREIPTIVPRMSGRRGKSLPASGQCVESEKYRYSAAWTHAHIVSELWPDGNETRASRGLREQTYVEVELLARTGWHCAKKLGRSLPTETLSSSVTTPVALTVSPSAMQNTSMRT